MPLRQLNRTAVNIGISMVCGGGIASTSLAKEIGISRRRVAKCNQHRNKALSNIETTWTFLERATRHDSIPKEHSRPTGSKRDVCKRELVLKNTSNMKNLSWKKLKLKYIKTLKRYILPSKWVKGILKAARNIPEPDFPKGRIFAIDSQDQLDQTLPLLQANHELIGRCSLDFFWSVIHV